MKLETFVKIIGSTTVLGALLWVGGCGTDSSAPVGGATITNTNAIPAASVAPGAAAGSIAVNAGATVTAATAGGATAISIPGGTTITPVGGTFNANNPPAINVTTFTSLAALPAPATAGFVVDSTAGAVDVNIGGLNHVNFTGGQATITIPLSGTPTNCTIWMNKNDGNGYTNLGPGVCGGGKATIQVSNLCTFVVDPHFQATTGSTGSTGSTGGTGSSF